MRYKKSDMKKDSIGCVLDKVNGEARKGHHGKMGVDGMGHKHDSFKRSDNAKTPRKA